MGAHDLYISEEDVKPNGHAKEPVIISGHLRRSASIGQLTKALAAARKNFKPVTKNHVNPFYKSKYADLSDLIDATVEALSGSDLAVIQSPSSDSRQATVTTLLSHSSGEWLESSLTMPAGDDKRFDAQTTGSAITYARRYAYQSILNIAAEEDDDGNAAISGGSSKPPVQMPQRKSGNGAPTFAQKFWGAARKNGKTDEQVRSFLGSEGYESTADVPEKAQAKLLDWAEGK